MPRTSDTVTLEEAKRILSAGEAKANSLGIAYNLGVVDAGGHLVAFVRQDSALIGSIDLAINKAVTASIFNRATSDLARLAQSGDPLFGIQESNAGEVVILGGGIPVIFDGNIVGPSVPALGPLTRMSPLRKLRRPPLWFRLDRSLPRLPVG